MANNLKKFLFKKFKYSIRLILVGSTILFCPINHQNQFLQHVKGFLYIYHNF